MWVKKEGHISHIIPGDFMWVEDEEWNSFMTHLFLCGLYKKVFYFYLAQVVFQYLKKMCVRGGGGLVPALKFFVGMLRPI